MHYKPLPDEINIVDNEKLLKIGYMDGYERAIRIIEREPENLDLLEVIDLPVYHEGYLAGIAAAKKDRGITSSNTPVKK